MSLLSQESPLPSCTETKPKAPHWHKHSLKHCCAAPRVTSSKPGFVPFPFQIEFKGLSMCSDNSVADTIAPCSGWQSYSPSSCMPFLTNSHPNCHTGTICGALQEFLYTHLGSALLSLALPMSPQLLWLLQLSHCPEIP